MAVKEKINNPGELTELRNITVGSFLVRRFTESTNPELVEVAQRIHAYDYLISGYVSEDAIIDGKLRSEIDTARGDTVTYYLGQECGDDDNKASTIRKKYIAPDGSIEDLSAFENSIGSLYAGEEDVLRSHISKFGAQSVVEVGALARACGSKSSVSMKLIRTAVHDAVRENPHERWMILFADPAYRSMERFYGPTVARRIGHEAIVSSGKSYINDKLSFIPSVIEPANVLDTLAQEASSPDLDSRTRSKRLQAFKFMSEGAEDIVLGDRAQDLYEQVMAGEQSA